MLVYNGGFHFMEKVNGIKYLYAWLDKHPDVRAMVADCLYGRAGGAFLLPLFDAPVV